MPPAVICNGQRYDYVQTFKHDFFAATGLYRGPDGLAVLKLGRQADAFTVPLRWVGRLLTRRELSFYSRLQDVACVPRLIGPVGDAGFLHAFVAGHPLQRREQVSDAFFGELGQLLGALHTRHMAYVDLNKRENILVGDDGRPYLIDFQIALHLPPVGWRRLPPLRWLLARLQHGDRYHWLKHKRRLRPDLLTPAERAEVERLSFWIRLHRVLTRPLTSLRRRLLGRLRKSETAVVAGSTAK